MNQQARWSVCALFVLAATGVAFVVLGYGLAWGGLWLPPLAMVGVVMLLGGIGLIVALPFLWRRARKSSDDAAV